jgi:hypothetical protein
VGQWQIDVSRPARSPHLPRLLLDGLGRWDEWHLDFGKAFRHFAFEFLAWFCQPREMVATALLRSWFEAIGTIGHLVSGYRM